MKNRIAYPILGFLAVAGISFNCFAQAAKDSAIFEKNEARAKLEKVLIDVKLDIKLAESTPIYFTDTETTKFLSFWATILGFGIGTPSFVILLISWYYSVSKDQPIYNLQKLVLGTTKKG